MRRLAICWLAVLFLSGVSPQHAATIPPPPPAAVRLPRQRYEADFVAMGMKYHIALFAPNESTAIEAINSVMDRVHALDRTFSDYNTESELSRLCEHCRPGMPVRVSPELFEVLSHAESLAAQTHGAFDVTIGPVIELWRTARRQKRLPPPPALLAARQKVGWSQLHLDPLNRTVEFTQPGLQIDLGGIAAGYALDEAAELLKIRGLTCVLMDASGDIRVGDPPPGRPGWRVTVSGLAGTADASEAQELILQNCSITTSGDARQFVEIEGTRYSHIVDPRTGLGMSCRSSTTIIAPTGWQADSYATAVNVMGSSAGLRWLESQSGCQGVMFEKTATGISRRATSNFPQTRVPAAAPPP